MGGGKIFKQNSRPMSCLKGLLKTYYNSLAKQHTFFLNLIVLLWENLFSSLLQGKYGWVYYILPVLYNQLKLVRNFCGEWYQEKQHPWKGKIILI